MHTDTPRSAERALTRVANGAVARLASAERCTVAARATTWAGGAGRVAGIAEEVGVAD